MRLCQYCGDPLVGHRQITCAANRILPIHYDPISEAWHNELDRYEAAMCYNPHAAPPPEGTYDDD